MTCPSQRDILSRHCLYQKSWCGSDCNHQNHTLDFTTSHNGNTRNKGKWKRSSGFLSSSFTSISHVKEDSSHQVEMEKNSIDLTKLMKSETNINATTVINSTRIDRKKNSQKRERHKCLLSTPALTSSGLMNYSFASLAERREKRVGRRKPWLESSSSLGSHDSGTLIFYEKYIPKDIQEGGIAKRVTRKYVTNSKYGNVYEIRLNKEEHRSRTPPLGTWLWEDEMKIWTNSTKSLPDHFPSDVERTTTPIMKAKSFSNTPRNIATERSKPHADLFAHYHSYRLERERRRDAAVIIQKVFRGWSVRNTLRRLKRKVMLEHRQLWAEFIDDYRRLVVRLQARFGNPRGQCHIDFKQLEDYMNNKYKYEQMFDKFDDGNGSTAKGNLQEFVNKCEIEATQKKLSRAFDNVFKGGRGKAEIVFMLDCSPIGGEQGFRYVTSFIKDVISCFQVNPDHVRVAVIPYSDKVSQTFELSKHHTKRGVLDAIDHIMVMESDMCRPCEAIRCTQRMLINSRPGIQQIAILITDRKSSSKLLDLVAAQSILEYGVNFYIIGIGHLIDKTELEKLLSTPDHLFTVSSYPLLKTVKDLLIHSANLVSQKGDTILGNCRPLTKDEALEICWTLSPPEASLATYNPPSSWLKPVVDGMVYDFDDDKWAILDDEDMKTTNIQACLKVVIQSKLHREGFVYLPASDKYGVIKVTDEDQALKIINDWIKTRQNSIIEKGDKYDSLSHWLKYK